jgi:glycosyltransferase involved in cell wall biosynthesis
MEALALRRPVICTAVGGTSELVTPGECGWLVAPGSERELADAMRDALTRPANDLDKMGQRGSQRVAAVHDATAQAHRLAQLFLDSRVGASSPSMPR